MTHDIADHTPVTITLRDGRTLAWYEFGDPAGRPVIHVTGTPVSGILGVLWDDLAREAGIRWIAIDKPGYGHSTVDPQLSLARAAVDLRELLDALDIERAPLVGESGGAPYVLAAAHDMPERVTGGYLIAGMGPGSEAWARKEMKPSNKQALWMGKYAPFLLRSVMKRIAAMDQATYTAWLLNELPAPDRAVLDRHPELAAFLYFGSNLAFRQGTRAAAQEMTMFAHPWHFEVGDVSVPIEVWHGTEDVNVPIAIANEVIRRLPDSRAHIIEGKGHMLAVEHREDVLAAIVEAGR